MEEIKFYDVKVGHSTKRGGFNAITSFVCKSTSSQYVVQDIYRQNYKGLNVIVSEIIDVQELKIKSNSIEIQEKDNEIKELNKKYNELKEMSNKTFEILKLKSDYDSFSLEVKDLNKSLKDKYKELEEIKKELEEMVKKEINNKYDAISRKISFNEFYYPYGNLYHVKYSIELNGTLSFVSELNNE